MGKIVKLKRKNSPDTEGGGDTRFSIVFPGEGALRTSGDESSSRLSNADTRAMRVVAAPVEQGL
jgi:hypothetical protein